MHNLTANEWSQTMESYAEDAGDGKWLEQLVSDLGHRIPEWDLVKVFRWRDWPDRRRHFPNASHSDVGIDNVGIRSDGTFIAIQCKARSGNSELSVADLGPFALATGDDTWSELWVVSNSKFSRGVKEASLRSEARPIKLVDFVAPVRALALQESIGIADDHQLTLMQNRVVDCVLTGLRRHSQIGRREWNKGEARGHIVLPCGTGKTRVAYRVMKSLLNPGELAVILVPSIALVSQLKGEFQTLARRDKVKMRTLAVCSDRTAGRTNPKSEDRINLSNDPSVDTSYMYSYEVTGDTATNEAHVADWLTRHKSKSSNSILVMFSTYQSAHNTAYGLRHICARAKLMVCDEAHRTAGIKKIPAGSERLRNFTLCHDKDKFPATYRLYQTATPRIYSKPSSTSKNLLFEDDSKWDIRSMNDVTTFGPELYRLSYVEAVQRNLLSDYRIIAWGISGREAAEAQVIATKLNSIIRNTEDASSHWDTSKAMRALTLAAFLSGCVPKAHVKSVIAFCNRIRFSSDLALAVASEPVQQWLDSYFKRLGLKHSPAKFSIKHVDASFHSGKRNEALYQLRTASQDSPVCISNVGIFSEGTDSPSLSAVAFLNPRKSPVDVIQSVGRAMRKSPDKERGYILVPVFIPPNTDPENFLRNSNPEHGWEELGQILQALRAHDGRIEDHLESLMEFYLPPPPIEPVEHLVVVKEPHRHSKVFVLNTKTPAIEQVIAPSEAEDYRSIEERLRSDTGTTREIVDVSKLSPLKPPRSISAVVVGLDHKPYIADLTYAIKGITYLSDSEQTWDPEETIGSVRRFIRKDRQRKKKQMRPVLPRKLKNDRQSELGLKLVHLEGAALSETGIHLNLLEKSGIQSGPRRDLNILRGTVKTVAEYLRKENLEDILALRLGMENVERSSKGAADACVVTAVIWVNAAIMHARLANSESRQLRNIPNLETTIVDVTPARGLMDAWGRILIKDYVPIFEVALQLLQDVAFKDLASISDALRIMAKDCSEIADHYANLGMDHAGELFNEVMGNQRSDGAFFTRPLAASMLVELCLNASQKKDWLDEQSWSTLRTFDPACGSGTILVAMMNAIKRRIRLAGGTHDSIRKFHRFAVEHLMVGADVNPVALQLAGCQLSLGDVSVAYDKMNLHLMQYGSEDSEPDELGVKTGTIELLTDERIVTRPNELSTLSQGTQSKRINLKQTEDSNTFLGDELHESPPFFNLMNPPYTSWGEIGSKFSQQVQLSLRKRLAAIWDSLGNVEPILNTRKTSIATLFELLTMKLTRQSKGVMGFVRAATILTAEESRQVRMLYAREAHVDFVLTSHDPANCNLSWGTGISECLIVMSNLSANQDKPTLFINLHRFPESLDEAYEVIERAVLDKPFNGSSIFWDYDLMKQGNWTPAIFADGTLAQLFQRSLANSRLLRTDLIGSKLGGKTCDKSTSKLGERRNKINSVLQNGKIFKVDCAGGDWRKTASPSKCYDHFDVQTDKSEPAISGLGMDGQSVLSGTVNKWIRLVRLPEESDSDYDLRLRENKRTLANYRSHLLVADSHNSASSRLVAVASSTPRIGYSWMPVLGEKPMKFDGAKAIAIWLNSTLGRIALRTVGARTVNYPKFRPISFNAIAFPDIENPRVVKLLSECFDETCSETVPQFREGRMSLRERWDDAVAVALEIDRNLIATCAETLSADPFVARDRFYE